MRALAEDLERHLSVEFEYAVTALTVKSIKPQIDAANFVLHNQSRDIPAVVERERPSRFNRIAQLRPFDSKRYAGEVCILDSKATCIEAYRRRILCGLTTKNDVVLRKAL
ncbi:hypothetical protein [uncultured Sphingomonas sp.]|uniref:hypothetical protein n=1 Tax=uncultured Sphingomonas sp. TaxID=158754 RepID=UPI0025DB5CA0|nr:hypothetical protein [uncultured Sphingomonas sp.]